MEVFAKTNHSAQMFIIEIIVLLALWHVYALRNGVARIMIAHNVPELRKLRYDRVSEV